MPGKTEESRQTIKNSVGRAVLVAISVLLQVFWIVLLVMRLNQYYAYISLATSVLSFLVVLHICGNKINAAYKLSWIVLIQFMPILGLCLFLMFGKESSNAVMRRRFGRIDQQMPRYLPQDEATAARLDAENPGLGNQAHYLRNTAGFPVYGDTRVTFYGDTNEALEAQKAELRKAEHFIFMEYHAIEDSTAWRGLEEILAEKAAAGVDVRVFYDDMGSIGFISKPFARRLQAQGIQCRVFNPLVPVLNVFMNNRDHRKITVVDGQVGFTGGYNLADEYFNLTHPYGQWKDSGLRLEGSAGRSLTVIFLEMWNATQKVQEDPTPFLVPAAVPQGAGGYVIPYADSPLDTIATGEDVYLNILKNAKRYVYITTPYLIIDDEMQRELTLAARRGVDVRIITPGIPDKKTVFRVTRSYYADLATAGVRIFEYTPGFVHAKQFVADDEVATCGTINMDYRSLYLHFENGCWFSSCDAVAQVRRDFEELFPLCTEVTGQYAGKRERYVRGLNCILRLFGPLM